MCNETTLVLEREGGLVSVHCTVIDRSATKLTTKLRIPLDWLQIHGKTIFQIQIRNETMGILPLWERRRM